MTDSAGSALGGAVMVETRGGECADSSAPPVEEIARFGEAAA